MSSALCGGAVGISGLYLVFHASYSARLNQAIARGPLPKFTAETGLRFKNDLLAAEQTGLNPQHFDARFRPYLYLARSASDHGYIVAMVAIAVLALVGVAIAAILVRRPGAPELEFAAEAVAQS